MSGYQEAMTDPSYAGQLITFTYPQIGNYGVSAAAMESDRSPRARGDHARSASTTRTPPRAEAGWLDWLDRLRRPGDHGRRHAGAGAPYPRPGRDARRHLPGERDASSEARELIAAEPSMAGRDLARDVTPARAHARAPGAARGTDGSP